MNSLTIAGIGELLWDILPTSEEIGGAPINFAYHVQALGATGIPVSTVGDDPRGKNAISELQKRHLNTDTISISPDHPTGYVTADLNQHGVATYTFPANIAWDHLQLNQAALRLAANVDAVCFGSLAQRSETSRSAIYDFISATPGTAFKIFDLNLRQDFFSPEIIINSLHMADILKLNDEELPHLAKLLSLSGTATEILTSLQNRFDLQLTALTRGAHGSILLAGDTISDHPGFPTVIVDTIGAGDAFTAATSLGFLLNHDLNAINEHANKLAAYVCGQSGAMPKIPPPLRLC